MDVFSLRNNVIGDYGTYVRSFLTIKDERTRRLVEEEMSGGRCLAPVRYRGADGIAELLYPVRIAELRHMPHEPLPTAGSSVVGAPAQDKPAALEINSATASERDLVICPQEADLAELDLEPEAAR